MKTLSKIFGKLKGPPDFWKMSDSKRRDAAVALLMAGEIDRFNEGIRLACGLNLAATALFRNHRPLRGKTANLSRRTERTVRALFGFYRAGNAGHIPFITCTRPRSPCATTG